MESQPFLFGPAEAVQEAQLEPLAASLVEVEPAVLLDERPPEPEPLRAVGEPEPEPAPPPVTGEEIVPFALFGTNLFGDAIEPPSRGKLSDRFVVPPFTVLDARQGYWQDRKRAWIALGIQSELGRGAGVWVESNETGSPIDRQSDYQLVKANATPGGSLMPAADYSNRARGDGRGRPIKQAFGQEFALGAQPSHGGPGKSLAKDGDEPSARQLLRESMTDEEWAAVKASEPGGGGGPNSGYNRGRKADGNLLGYSRTATNVRHGVGFNGAALLQTERGDLDRTHGIGATADCYRNAGEPVDGAAASGTSIFDPVLCELTYRWFTPPGGVVLDPFAGGSVRGITAALLGLRYVGIDLSARQIAANRSQAERLCAGMKPTWVVGDSATVEFTMEEAADVVFSCPPYGDLEVYSDDPKDISAMPYAECVVSYRAIVARAVSKLKPDRFAVFVVGDFRDERGFYRRFVNETVEAFLAAGCQFYNDAVLITSVGSLPIRVSRMFNSARKLGKTHQNYLCFVKGDPRRATEACNGQLELP